MSQYDDDALALSDECDLCGRMFYYCNCQEEIEQLMNEEADEANKVALKENDGGKRIKRKMQNQSGQDGRI